MATLVLTAAASAATASFGSGLAATFAGAALTTAATLAGHAIDSRVFGVDTTLPATQGSRLADLAVQTSTYGKMIPVLYGTARMAGNIIWSRPIKETAVTTTHTASGGKGGGGTVTQEQTTYQYSVSLAIAVCEGEIDEILRVWADAKLLDPENAGAVAYRLYKGSEDQLPDSFIESFEGVNSTPAYRGLAYVVIEDFPLADYGNRIPNFTFEVKKRALGNDSSGQAVENMIQGMVMIPASGEFVYDTNIQYKIGGDDTGSGFAQVGNRTRINQHNRQNQTDALTALDQLEATCPNVGWISVVVGWFGNDLDAGTCTILPGVEYQSGATTEPDTWAVGSFIRTTAYQVSLDENGNPVYGGTVSDASLLRYLTELRNRGYSIMLYPIFFMDTENKPWRGRVTGSATDVANFFTKTNGYNAFITHYANLVDGYVDAFIIGSELIGLTKVKDGSDNFPAVDALVSLAATVKGVLGSSVKVSYAADWSEYHHTVDGWYNLDPLWASADIDFIGIDAYFPLTDEPQSGITHQKIVDGWTSGEGYDWYYSDSERTTQVSLDPEFAWKNIAWWWENEHVNPDMATTDWVPESKKIWFTEYGFPSVDGSTNQPNVFYDPNSSESHYPYHSRGRIDFRAQRMGIAATLEQWDSSMMIERLFLWTWDARPFPFWPDLTNIWTDGPLWKPGHWVQGKLGLSSLAAIVQDICVRAGLDESDIDVTRLTDLVDGYILTDRNAARGNIEPLQRAYFFDAVESDGVLKFVPRGGSSILSIPENDLVPANANNDSRELLNITRLQELELPQAVDIVYLNTVRDYQTGTQTSQRLIGDTVHQVTIGLPIVMGDQQAKNIADVSLFNAWMERTRYSFQLPMEYAALEPTDIVEVTAGSATHTIRITSTQLGSNGEIRLQGVAEDVTNYDFYNAPGTSGSLTQPIAIPPETSMVLLDIPAFPGDADNSGILRMAVHGLEEGWNGSVIYRSDDGGSNYTRIANALSATVMGTVTSALATGPLDVFDETTSVSVNILGDGELESVTTLAVLNGTNLALIGDEVVQFRTATLTETGKYTLSGFLRGRFGTEEAISGHTAGERFILLNSLVEKVQLPVSLIGLPRDYKAVTVGKTLGQTTAQSFTYSGVALQPLSPVHIKGERDGSDNLTISWTRRTRINGEWRDNVDVPLNEESERYAVDIMDGSNVVRTITGLISPSATYTAVEQTTDFGSVQSSVTVQVYQLSALVGRGKKGEGVV